MNSAVQNADKETLIFVDGFSCREQIKQKTGRNTLHLAQLNQQDGINRKECRTSYIKSKIMKWKLLNQAPQKTYALIFETGDEVMSNLTTFAEENNLHASQFSAIGALEKAELGFFDVAKKAYRKIPVNEQVEVLSLNGDVAVYENKPVVHAHVVLGKSDGSTIGGHLKKAIVRPTLEVILNESPSFLQKKFDKETGLPLISL